MTAWEPIKSAPPQTWLRTKRAGEYGENRCYWRRIDGDIEWVDEHGRTTVTHGSFAPPTHWAYIREEHASREHHAPEKLAPPTDRNAPLTDVAYVNGWNDCRLHVRAYSASTDGERCRNCGSQRQTYHVEVCPQCDVRIDESQETSRLQQAEQLLGEARALLHARIINVGEARRREGVKPAPVEVAPTIERIDRFRGNR